MTRFTNLHETGLRRCKNLHKVKSTCDGDDIVHNMLTSFSTDSSISSSAPKSMLERITCYQDKASSLIVNTINRVSENLLISICNDMHLFIDMLHQANWSEFIKAMETEMDAHQ